MSEEPNLKQMWIDVQRSFEKKTKKSLKQAKNQSLDDVLAEVKMGLDPQDPRDRSQKALVKDLVTDVLHFLQLLGGIAAQGATAVFGPANLCFNALSSLINTPAEIAGFYDNLVVLFEEISTAMKHFYIYRRIERYANADLGFQKDTHRIMIAFVDICAISIDVLSGGNTDPWRTMTKLVLFVDDSGMQAKLHELRTLIDHQTRYSNNAVTLEHILRTKCDPSTSSFQVFVELNKAAEQNSKEWQKMQESDGNVSNIKAGTEMILEDVSEQISEKGQGEGTEDRYEKPSIPRESAMTEETQLKSELVEENFSRADHDLSFSEKAQLIDNLIKTAGQHAELGNIPDAVNKLEEAIRLDEHYYKSHYELFKLLNDTKRGPEAMRVLDDMDKAPAAQHEGLTKLSSMLLEYHKWIGETESLEKVLRATDSHEVSYTILSALRKALEFSLNENMDSHVLDLYLAHGLALASADRYKEDTYSALGEWEKCFQIGIKSEQGFIQSQAIEAATLIFNYYFSRALAARELSSAGTDDYRCAVKEMEDIAERSYHDDDEEYPLKASLASFYAREGNLEKAQELLVNDLREGIDRLADGSSFSNSNGYQMIASCLMHTGDDLNALSAWSLHGIGEIIRDSEHKKLKANRHPDGSEGGEKVENLARLAPEASLASERLKYFCSGPCGKWFTYADSFWFCKVCSDMGFCDECLGKIQNGTLHCRVCSADHQWLLVPSWLDEWKAVGPGRVCTGGKLINGKRVGGDIVSASDWLDAVKKLWKLPVVRMG